MNKPLDKIVTWNDIKRSEEPFPWRKLFDRATLTIKDLNEHISKLLKEKKQ